MSDLQQEFDDAMYAFSMADYDGAISALETLLEKDPTHFDAQLALGMAHYRKGDYPRAIQEGHKAESMKPKEQLVHTNLSLFYMKAGDKIKAEHHGLQARISSWRNPSAPPADTPSGDPELQLAKEEAKEITVTGKKLPDMPWKKNKPLNPPSS